MQTQYSEEQIIIMKDVHDSVLDSLGKIKLRDKAPKTIYHYTSIQNLYSILDKGEFWITHIQFMNDSSETHYFWEIVEQALSTIPKDIELFKENSVYKNLVGIIESKKKIIKSDDHFKNQYALSLSSHSNALSMWNYYGKNDGYCIGLSSNLFLNKLKHMKDTKRFDKYLAAHVLYDKKKQLEILKLDSLKTMKWFTTNYNKDQWRKIDIATLFEACVSSMISHWLNYLPFFKHESFKEESEFRVVIQHEKNSKDIEYRAYQGVIAPYIKYNFTVYDEKLPLQSIQAGPLIQHDLAMHGLEKWLRTKKLAVPLEEIKLTKSDIPLRF